MDDTERLNRARRDIESIADAASANARMTIELLEKIVSYSNARDLGRLFEEIEKLRTEMSQIKGILSDIIDMLMQILASSDDDDDFMMEIGAFKPRSVDD